MKSLILLLSLSIIFTGCRPEDEATQYNITDRNALAADDPLLNNYCALPADPDLSNADNIEACQLQQGCQAVYDNGGSNYIGCIPTIDNNDSGGSGSGDAGSGGSGGSGDAGSGGSSGSGDSGSGDAGSGGSGSGGSGDDMDGGINPTPPVGGNEGGGSSIADARCDVKGKKVFICHKNQGSKREKTLCISINGWLNGHHEGHPNHDETDQLGACSGN